APARSVYEQAGRAGGAVRERGGQAVPARSSTQQHWQESLRMRAVSQARMQEGQRRGRGTAQAWQESIRLRAAASTHMQDAQRRGRGTAQAWQESIRLRGRADLAFGTALVSGAPGVASSLTDGLAVRHPWRARYEEAMRPGPGRTPAVAPPVEPPCYVPGLPAHLVFYEPWSPSGDLLFICCKGGSNPEPPRYLIPLLRVYMTVHTIDAVLLPSLERVPLQSLSITTNDDDYGWTMSASGKLSLLDQLAARQGVPQQIRVTIDGIQWVFAVDPPARTRKFAEHAVQVTGRSVTSLLAAPYFPSTDWANTMPRTAQQLVLEALDLTGVTLDWQLDDWLVPANIWSHGGTPLSVAQRIAEAAGGVVRSHRFEPQLQIAPRFPHMPWAWSDAVADVRMPAQIITSDSLQATRVARYNAVYVAGTGQGLPLGHVVRTGTAGDRLAPQVTDALITDTVAARLRGQSVLAASVITHQQPITVPLLTGGTNPGLILPGYLIEVQEPAETWRGLVRGITVSVDAPTVRQTLDVERSIA
ncbi:hypothetical protein, partial [Delftia acidovorans]|uniref:hypothetical protein n=1 Tax=Delftia acidovorans TaxID=80866 RepID=UPI0030EC9B75